MDPENEQLIDPNEEHEQPQPGPVGDGQPQQPKEKKPEVSPEVKEMRRALAETRRALRTTTDALATIQQQRAPRQEQETEEESEPTLSVDLVEAITNGDPKAIKKAMRELGFVSEQEVEQRIQAKTTAISNDQQLYKDFPELADPKSPFFKTTARIYNDLAASDPSLKKSGKLAEIAAKLADRELGGRDGAPRRDRREQVDDYDLDRDLEGEEDDDEERERVERVRRQSGDRGRGSARRGADRESDELDQTQKTIVAKLRAAGADISEDGYRKRAQKGVRMAGLPSRRPRY